MKVCPSCGIKYPDALANCPQDGTPLPRVARTQQMFDSYVGSTIDGRYLIEAKLGEGGMGVVYAARHVIIDKRFAIKVLKKEVQHDESAGQRFIQEARSASSIGHTNIVDITDFGVGPDGSAYFVMEFLEGQTLGRVIEQGALPAGRAVNIAAQIARGLNAAHGKGVIHRDLKPDNIFLMEREAERDVVKLVDFGIAKVQSSSQKLTQVGMVLGTPEYISPEQATGKPSDHRIDEYALGCILYEMLTGDVPFRGKTSADTLSKHVFEQPVPLRKRRPDLDIPVALEALVLKAMARKPDDRYPDMKALLQALDQAGRESRDPKAGVRRADRQPPGGRALAGPVEEPLTIPRRRLSTTALLGVGGAAVLLAGGAWLFLGRDAPVPPAAPLVAATPHAAAAASGRAAVPTTGSPTVAPPTPSAPTPAATAANVGGEPAARGSVSLTLRSSPPGAAVVCDGERIGTTPLVFRHELGSKALRVSFKLSGYKDIVRDLVPDGDRDVEVALPARGGERGRGAANDDGGHPTRERRPSTHNTDLRDPFR